MRDIVETIQAEQDRVIRADLGGVLVVQGGPGTGKTAVALHRAAYLLYTHRQQLSSRGVLIVGPNATFLRYISQVLPSLAETGVLLRTLGDLFPGVTARGRRAGRGRRAQGPRRDGRGAGRGGRATGRSVPDEPIDAARSSGRPLTLDRDGGRAGPGAGPPLRPAAQPGPRRLRRARSSHALAGQVAERDRHRPVRRRPARRRDAPGDPMILDEADLAEIRRELREDAGVQRRARPALAGAHPAAAAGRPVRVPTDRLAGRAG